MNHNDAKSTTMETNLFLFLITISIKPMFNFVYNVRYKREHVGSIGNSFTRLAQKYKCLLCCGSSVSERERTIFNNNLNGITNSISNCKLTILNIPHKGKLEFCLRLSLD